MQRIFCFCFSSSGLWYFSSLATSNQSRLGTTPWEPSIELFYDPFREPFVSHASLRQWVDWLVSQSSSPSNHAPSGAKAGDKDGGLRGAGREEDLDMLPYRGVFVTCEGMEPAEAKTLCDDLRAAVSTRLTEG